MFRYRNWIITYKITFAYSSLCVAPWFFHCHLKLVARQPLHFNHVSIKKKCNVWFIFDCIISKSEVKTEWCEYYSHHYSNIRSVGWHSIFNFEIRISNMLLFFFFFFFFFFNTWHPPRNGSQLVRLAEHLLQQQTVRQWKTFVLTYSMHIFHEKSSISHKRACRTSTFEIIKHAKDATCERTLCYHKTECDACVFFLSTVPRCERKSWISLQ